MEAKNAVNAWNTFGSARSKACRNAIFNGYTIANDNSENPAMAKAHTCVDHWPEAFKTSKKVR